MTRGFGIPGGGSKRSGSCGCALSRRHLDGDAEVELLIELWALGLMAATTSQMIGAAAMWAAPRAPMSAVASMGGTSGSLDNAHRDLERNTQHGWHQ